MEKKIRNLKADEIECRVGTVTEKGITLLLYKNARVDQAVLDETFGINGWERTHCEIKGELYCTVSVWDDEKQMWIHKQDVGTESEYEKAKGAASDSFKRACFNLGIGRELYTAPFIFIPSDRVRIENRNGKKMVKDTFSVSSIAVVEEKISALEIVNQKGETVFSFKAKGRTRQGEDAGEKERALFREMGRTGVTEEEILRRYGLSALKDIDETTYLRIMTALCRTKTAA